MVFHMIRVNTSHNSTITEYEESSIYHIPRVFARKARDENYLKIFTTFLRRVAKRNKSMENEGRKGWGKIYWK
jgi:hypothetical protein